MTKPGSSGPADEPKGHRQPTKPRRRGPTAKKATQPAAETVTPPSGATADSPAQAQPRAEEPAPAEEPKPSRPGGPPQEPEAPAEPVTVYTTVLGIIELLSVQALQRLGLITDPQTKRVEKDLQQAQLAIDCIAFLLEKVEDRVSPEQRRELRRVLSDLRINFVEQSRQQA